jgi:SWI/SNF-related matrix-associated actin-dependent regulator 1 of chromatin subfamily A
MTNTDIFNAAQTLASVCDGAISDDGQGYNGRDAPFIHSVLRQEFPPTPKQIAAIYKILRTYKIQLSGMGIEYADLQLGPNETPTTIEEEIPKATIRRHQVDPSWKDFKIHFGKKHNGESLYQIFIDDPQYLKWIAQNFDDGDIKNAAIAILSDRGIKKEDVIDSTITLDYKDDKVVITSPFEAKFLCQELSIREWDGDNWTCPSMIIDEIIETFHNSSFEWKSTTAFEYERDRIDALRNTSNAIDSDFVMPDEFGSEKSLYPYQLVGAKFIEMSNGNCMISDTVGLGKSAQALSFVFNHPEMYPVVIVCPSTVKYQWDEYCRTWIPGCDTQVIDNAKEEIVGDIIILNYDILKKNLIKLQKVNPQIVILDESHKVKNYKSQRTIAAVDLASRIPHRILISGTPASNRTSELWKQLEIVRPDIYNRMTFTKWHKKYCDAKKTDYGWDYSGNSNTEELAEELKFIMLRRTEEEVFDELPEMIRTTVPVLITNRKVYNAAKENHLQWIAEQKGLAAAEKASRAEHLSRIAVLKRLAAEGKLESAISWMRDYLENEDKIVVFAHHKSIISKLKEEFGDECVVIDGDTPQKDRIPITDRFESDPKIKILIGNMKAASEGLNLGISKTVVHLEFDWSPKTHEQCEGRIKGLRQMGRGRAKTHSIYIVGLETIDIEIIDMLETKRKVIDTAMSDDTKMDFDFFVDLVK